MYSMMVIINSNMLCIWKLLRKYILKVLTTSRKFVWVVIDVNQTYCDDHFTVYTDIESLLYTWNEYDILCQLYLNIFKNSLTWLNSKPWKKKIPVEFHTHEHTHIQKRATEKEHDFLPFSYLGLPVERLYCFLLSCWPANPEQAGWMGHLSDVASLHVSPQHRWSRTWVCFPQTDPFCSMLKLEGILASFNEGTEIQRNVVTHWRLCIKLMKTQISFLFQCSLSSAMHLPPTLWELGLMGSCEFTIWNKKHWSTIYYCPSPKGQRPW